MKLRMFDWARRLFEVPTDDVELVRAQFQAFAKQIPLLYFILAVNTIAVIFTFAPMGPRWIAIYLPSCMCAFCAARAVAWWRLGQVEATYAAALRQMQTTNKLAFVLAITFSVWGMTLYPYGDPYAKAQMVFFLALTMISCIFCLMHLRSAALSVTLVGVIPFCVYFCFADQGHFRPAAINLALVAVGMIAILMIYYRDFAHLVASRRALAEKQSETQRLSDENLRLANIDSLSDLPNRRALMTTLDRWRGAGADSEKHTSIVFVDLDGFKEVNDSYGHETGDRLIKLVAELLRGLTPEGAMLSRLGGDEFAFLIRDVEALRAARDLAAAVLAILAHPLRIGERTVRVGASIGISCAAPGECDGRELFRRADIAMYDVKANGKSGVTVYTPHLDVARSWQHTIEAEIRAGLQAGEFDVVYQPIVEARTQRVMAVEALLRWPRRPGSPMGPDQFIGVAEVSGLIHQLGLFVLRRACRDLLAFDDIQLNVNISPAQFHDPDFEAKVGRVLAEIGFPAKRLELELTEGYLIDQPQRAAAAISSLKAMGISVALDDFGAGHASIGYLKEYGFDRIKIDRSLAGEIAKGGKAGVLITGTVFIANGLNMGVVAEGVETEEQEALLCVAGCHHLQGYLFCRPKPIEDLVAADFSIPMLSGRAPSEALAALAG